MKAKITSIKKLADELHERSVYMFEIGANLHKRVELWSKKGQINVCSGNGIRFIQLIKK